MSVAEMPHYIIKIIRAILLFCCNNIIVTPRELGMLQLSLYHPSTVDSRLHAVSGMVARQQCLALLHVQHVNSRPYGQASSDCHKPSLGPRRIIKHIGWGPSLPQASVTRAG
jgi:hypothetical protein